MSQSDKRANRKTQPTKKAHTQGESQTQALLDPPQIKQFIRRYFRGQPEQADKLWSLILGTDHLLKAWKVYAKAGSEKKFWEWGWITGLKPDESSALRDMQRNGNHLLRLCRDPSMLSLACELYATIDKLPRQRAARISHFEDALSSRAVEKIGERMDAGYPASEFWSQNQWWTEHVWDNVAVKLAGSRDPVRVAHWVAGANPLLAARCLGANGYSDRSELAAALPELGEIALIRLVAFIETDVSFEWSSNPLPGLAALIAGSVDRGILSRERVIEECVPKAFHPAVYDWERIVGAGFLEFLLPTVDHLQRYAGQVEILSPAHRTKLLILTLDDEPAMHELLHVILLYRFGEQLLIVSGICSAGALILVSTLLPDLVLTDVMEPWMSGFEFAAYLKKNPITQNVPFVFVTARAQKEDVQKGMELGAADYVIIPYAPQDLIAVVQNVLGLNVQSSK